MATPTFRTRDGERIDVQTVAATRFKNEFGTIFEQAALGGAVAITKHNTPKAVLLSYAEFEALTKASMPALDDLSDQFDQLLESMQTPPAKSAMATAFDAAPEQLGRAAVKAARPNPQPGRRRARKAQPPRLYVLAGVNGAGKSSIGGAMIRTSGADYFNPDEAARDLIAANPGLDQVRANAAAWQQGRRLLERAIRERKDFGFKTTLARSTVR